LPLGIISIQNKETTMKRPSNAHPFMLWTNLAWEMQEMFVAAAQVVGHRTNRMMVAGPMPTLRDRGEFSLMGREKYEAAHESVMAMAVHMMRLNQQLGSLALKQMMTGASAALSVASSLTPAQSLDHQFKLAGDTMANSANATSHLSRYPARVLRQGLQPIHARATSNAKRLGNG
jgi:hypothetical protein